MEVVVTHRVLTTLKMNSNTWNQVRAHAAELPFFSRGTYSPYLGVEIEVDPEQPDGHIEPVYADAPDPRELIQQLARFVSSSPLYDLPDKTTL
jgi:hypothetical protein